MSKFSLLTIAIAMLFATATSAAILTFSDSGENLTVTAQEAGGGTSYWSLVVKNATANAPGRILDFHDLTGASDPAYNYTHRYDLGAGMLDPIDNGSMRDGGKYSIVFAPYADGDSSLSYTVSRVVTDGGGGTNTISSAFVINAPDANGTAINATTTLAFDALWTPGNGQGRVRPQMNLHNTVASDNGEWVIDAYNGFPDGANSSYIEAVSTGIDTGSAAGRSFTITLGWTQGDSAYDTTKALYNSLGAPRFMGQIEQGITGAWAGKPTAGESYIATVDLDINIAVPEPASFGLLAIGGLLIAARRR